VRKRKLVDAWIEKTVAGLSWDDAHDLGPNLYLDPDFDVSC